MLTYDERNNRMTNKNGNLQTKKKLQKAILREKAKGASDEEIGKKYGVTLRYIEKLITQSQGVNVSVLRPSKKIKKLHPKDFQEEQTTVWSFKQRGNWATHSGEYRGNWSPYIPRNVILKYSKPGELVLDCFCGAGTTGVEAKLLGRRCIICDINDKAVELAKRNINFEINSQNYFEFAKNSRPPKVYEPEIRVGDARDLSFLKNESIDLICTHPPYANIIHYTDSKRGDLSFCDVDEFLKEMTKVARENFRILKPGRQCAILIGDLRRKKHVIPLGFQLIDIYLDAGFKLKELIIKRQHNCKTTGFWYDRSIKYNFLLLAHEYLPIFEKPKSSIIKEKKANYYSATVPISKQHIPIRKKIDRFETTTVWIFPEESFEERLNKNIIDRYSNGRGYSTIILSPHVEDEKDFKKKEDNKKLLFLKSVFSSNNNTHLNIECYLQKIKEVINQNLLEINKDGFIAIHIEDVRINGYVEPIAKKIVEALSSNENLWLKEIIITVPENVNYQNHHSSRKHLKTAHQYLLVYDVVK